LKGAALLAGVFFRHLLTRRASVIEQRYGFIIMRLGLILLLCFVFDGICLASPHRPLTMRTYLVTLKTKYSYNCHVLKGKFCKF
jgi:hypothetical protein